MSTGGLSPNRHPLNRFELSPSEIQSIHALLNEITATWRSSEDADMLGNVTVLAHELPRRLRSFLNDFRLSEPASGIAVVSGFPIDDTRVGTTPSHWKVRAEASPALREEMFLLLCGSLLGEAIGWATQQNGFLVHDVIPIKGHELEQLGSSSEQLLWWHCEDAFHPYRGDYLGLLCMRNREQVPTTFACINQIRIDDAVARILLEPRFTIRPDESHSMKNAADPKTLDNADDAWRSAFERINQMSSEPEKVSVLFGDAKEPYLRLDPYFMDPLVDDPEAQKALDTLIASIDASLTGLVMQPGDCCFIDNYRTVHGRKPFTARYDGYDRWLKRINITRDLRKSRSIRPSCTSRVLH